MAKKSFTDLSDLKLVFSTDPSASPSFEEDMEQNDDKTPLAKQQLRITLDKKHRAGKEVTLLEGFDMNDDELNAMAKQLKSKCGIGGSVTEEGFILLQGDQRKKLPDILTKMGYKKIKVIGL